MAETCYDLNTAINKYTVLKPKINKFNIYWKNNAIIINEIRNDNTISEAMKKYIIGVKSSRKQFISRPVLDFSRCDIESDLMSNLSNVYQLLFEFYDKSLDWYKIAINDIQDYNKELRIRILGILKLFPFI